MCGSKYVQSILTQEMYESLESDLKQNRQVVFSGTPCQCAAVKKAFGDNKNLWLIDFVCHGCPSPNIWEKYWILKQKEWGLSLIHI